jgi:DNA modification methylase
VNLPAPYYADDSVTIYHGDCREMLADIYADVIVTDPPYGIAYVHGGGKYRPSPTPIIGDDLPFDPAPLLALARPTILWGGNHYASRLPDSPTWLVWDKKPSGWRNDQADAELAWTNLGGPARTYRHAWSGGGTLAHENGTANRVLHPAQKPIGLMRWCLGFTDGIALDPFMGSGSTLVAAKSLGRRSIGIEIEERYCEIAARRCSQEVLGLPA